MVLGWLPWKWSKFNKKKSGKNKKQDKAQSDRKRTKDDQHSYKAEQWRPWLGFKHRTQINKGPQPKKGNTKKLERAQGVQKR